MTTREADIRAVMADADRRIDAAYWRFTRCRAAPPPSLAEPEAYRVRDAARHVLAGMRVGARDVVRAARMMREGRAQRAGRGTCE